MVYGHLIYWNFPAIILFKATFKTLRRIYKQYLKPLYN